jgi:hypothetical protein
MPAQPFVPAELVGERLLMMFSMWLGDAQDPEGVAFVDRLNSYGTPCHTVSMVLPFGLGMQRVLDAQSPAGKRYYIKELHMRELAPEAVQRVVDFWTSMPMEGDISIASFGGAMADVPEDATAFANRQEICWLTFQLHWAEAEHDADYMARTRAAAQSLQQWVGSGLYMNMLSPDEMDRVVEGFGGPVKYARLGRIKAKYDPSNMFRLNANIVPVFD